MHTIKYTTLTFFFFLLITELFSQTTKVDSLKQMIENSSGEKKLELMFKLPNYYLFTPELITLSEEIKEEAIKQNNMRYVAASYGLKARYFSGSNNIDSTVFYAELANKIYEKHKIKNPNQTYYYMGKVYINNGYYELGIFNLKKYLEVNSNIDSYLTLAEAYIMAKKYDLAKEIAFDAINSFSLSQKQEKTEVEFKFYDVLTIANIYAENYEEALDACLTMEEILKQIKTNLHESVAVYYQYHIYNNYANIYLGKGDTKSAKKYLDKAILIPESDFSKYNKHETIAILGTYYFLTKNYDKALSYFEIALLFYKEENPNNTLVSELTDLKIKALTGLGRYKDALRLQNELSQHKDSVYQKNIPLQISQLSKKYELDKVRLEQEKDKANLERGRIIVFILIAITMLLFIVLFAIRHNNQILKSKNRVLYKQNEEIERVLRLIRGPSIKDNNNREKENVEFSLFDKIELYMQEKEAYKEPDLNREKMAREFSTNWLYIVNAIKEETGKTFLEYVNDYRLNHARKKILSDSSVLIGNVYIEAGFASYSTFHRLFKEKYGMSPNELRKTKDELDIKGITEQ